MTGDIVFVSLPSKGGKLDWNDAPERTHAEVVDLLDSAIARLGAA